MTRPNDLPGPERYAHGTRARYVTGCRCDECREANRLFYHVRVRAKMRGDWNGLVDAEPARLHLKKLSKQGVGRRAVGAASGVGDTTLSEVITGRKKQIQARTEKKILAVGIEARADHAFVSAKDSWKLLNDLLSRGHTKSAIAKRLGSKAKTPALQVSTDRILVRQARKIQEVYDALLEEERLAAEARKCKWCRQEHDAKDYLTCIREMLPCTSDRILKAWPRYRRVGGDRLLYMDLKSMGADADKGTWYIPVYRE